MLFVKGIVGSIVAGGILIGGGVAYSNRLQSAMEEGYEIYSKGLADAEKKVTLTNTITEAKIKDREDELLSTNIRLKEAEVKVKNQEHLESQITSLSTDKNKYYLELQDLKRQRELDKKELCFHHKQESIINERERRGFDWGINRFERKRIKQECKLV